MRHPGEGGQTFLDLRHLGAVDEAAVVQHGGDAGVDVGADALLLGHQVEQRQRARRAGVGHGRRRSVRWARHRAAGAAGQITLRVGAQPGGVRWGIFRHRGGQGSQGGGGIPACAAAATRSMAARASATSPARGVATSRPGKRVGRGGSAPWNSSSASFSPGRRPMKRIATSRSGSFPASRIIRRARSRMRTGRPMSRTKMPPSASSGRCFRAALRARHRCLQHKPHRFAHRHEVAAHVRMGDGERPPAGELAAEQRHHRPGRAEDIAEAHGDTAHPAPPAAPPGPARQ